MQASVASLPRVSLPQRVTRERADIFSLAKRPPQEPDGGEKMQYSNKTRGLRLSGPQKTPKHFSNFQEFFNPPLARTLPM